MSRSAISLVVVLALLALAPPALAGPGGKGRYIVVLKPGVSSPSSVAARHGRVHGAKVRGVFRHTIKGYAATLDAAGVAALRADPKVAFVERDGRVTIAKPARKPGGGGGGSSVGSWGLDRIDQRDLPLSGTFTTTARGSGVTVYVIDTGVRISHSEFGGRASNGPDFIDGDGVSSDCHGHGTHVAGTVGGKTFGVARDVRIKAVRVLDCSGAGTWSGVIAGLDWAVGDASGPGGAVVNMSLGGGASASVDAAVARAVSDGVSVVVAAGNSGADACGYSPARAPEALTVGATTSTDGRASYSNTGSCLDLFAPGSSITSAWRTKDNATKVLSGTSMASPHLAGVAALYLQGSPAASPTQVAAALTNLASSGKVSGAGTGSPNLLLYTNH